MTAIITTMVTIKIAPTTPPIAGPGSEDGEICFFDSSEEEILKNILYKDLYYMYSHEI